MFLFLLIGLSSLAQAKAPNVLPIWSEWYIYSVAGATQGYYQEKAEKRLKEKQLAISQNWLEKDDGGTESFIGSVASDDGKFSPIAFFSEKSMPKKSTKLDGRVKEKNIILTFKGVNPPTVAIKKTVALKANMVLSNFVGMMLSKNEGDKEIQFTAIVEDARDGNFDSRAGRAQVLGVNKQIQGNTCRKVLMNFDQIDSEWWITKEGKICEVFIPENQARLQLSTEEAAKKAYKQ